MTLIKHENLSVHVDPKGSVVSMQNSTFEPSMFFLKGKMDDIHVHILNWPLPKFHGSSHGPSLGLSSLPWSIEVYESIR